MVHSYLWWLENKQPINTNGCDNMDLRKLFKISIQAELFCFINSSAFRKYWIDLHSLCHRHATGYFMMLTVQWQYWQYWCHDLCNKPATSLTVLRNCKTIFCCFLRIITRQSLLYHLKYITTLPSNNIFDRLSYVYATRALCNLQEKIRVIIIKSSSLSSE